MIEADIRLSLAVKGPFMSRSSGMGGYGVDAVALRDRKGFPLLPGSQVRGRIREAIAELFPHDQDDFINRQFGPAVDREAIGESGLRPHAWYFGDFVASGFQQSTPYDNLLTRISIDENTGSTKRGAMLVAECSVPAGEQATFAGLVTLICSSRDELDEHLKRLTAAARWIPSVGSFRNVGFGRVAGAEAVVVEVRDWQGNPSSSASQSSWLSGASVKIFRPRTPSGNTHASTRLLSIRMEEPFCVGGQRRDRNVYRSLTHLPGSVLKGAVAYQLQRILGLSHRQPLADAAHPGAWTAICDHFCNVRFLTAFPAKCGAADRPLVDPLSLFKSVSNVVSDASFQDRPFLVKAAERSVAPEFSIDWKPGNIEGWTSGRIEPFLELRLHTAIEPGARRARDEHLFAHQLVHSESSDGTTNIQFLGRISLGPDIPAADQAKIWDELESLFEMAVFRIGKTKARARFQLSDLTPDPQRVSSTTPHSNRWVIVLQSPTLILDPRQVHDEWSKGLDNSAILYAEYFATESSSSLKLVNHFRDESLHGGFLSYRSNPHDYCPFLVTEAGSVFVLEAEPGKETTAQKTVQSWLGRGLPLPAWAIRKHGTGFSTNPFLPSDGCGEIVVNIPAHLDLAISESEVQPL